MRARRFHIAHIVHAVGHGLYGHREVIETLQWGLRELGYETSTAINLMIPNAVNIVVGFHMLDQRVLVGLPADTILYNFEQLGLDLDQIRPTFRIAAERFQIWDYSQHNIPLWERLGAAHPVVHVPIGWAPILARIPRADPMDIDVLFYGLPNPERLEVFRGICLAGLRCVFACGFYGDSRDQLISRSKIVLNLHLYGPHVFEVVRTSYLFANAKAVVSEFHPDTFIETDLRDAAIFVAPTMIPATCRMLIDNDRARTDLEQRGQARLKARHITRILRLALDKMSEFGPRQDSAESA